MKALSIKQPWASLIAHGIKDIENRTWKTNFRGRIYIHASAKWDERAKGNDASKLLTSIQYNSIPHKVHGLFLDQGIIVKDSEIPLSAIIGEVDIVDCVINHPSIWAEQIKTHPCENIDGLQILDKGQKYIWNWVLANPVLYEKPILNVKGKLSFWEWEGCEQECTSCDQLFDMMNMQRDGDDNYFCKECADELFPRMQKEYDEMVANGEIEPED